MFEQYYKSLIAICYIYSEIHWFIFENRCPCICVRFSHRVSHMTFVTIEIYFDIFGMSWSLWIPWSRHPWALADIPDIPHDRTPLWTYNGIWCMWIYRDSMGCDLMMDLKPVDAKYGLIWTMSVTFWIYINSSDRARGTRSLDLILHGRGKDHQAWFTEHWPRWGHQVHAGLCGGTRGCSCGCQTDNHHAGSQQRPCWPRGLTARRDPKSEDSVGCSGCHHSTALGRGTRTPERHPWAEWTTQQL